MCILQKLLSVVAFTLLVLIVLTNGSLKCDCKKAKCEPAVGCTVGTHKDMCGCCDVCAKEEGELCGGLNYVEGECGHRLQCMIRRIEGRRNRGKKSVSELVGRCEYRPCNFKRCSFGETCTLVNGTPTCICPACKEMSMQPVCGEENHEDYSNECKLRTDECLKGRKIGMVPGKCKLNGTSRVECRDERMRIEISKDFVGRSKNKKLTLLDTKCVFEQNQTHFFIDSKLQDCGTKANFALTTVIYSNTIRTELDPNTLIIRGRNAIQMPVECYYSLRSKSTNDVNFATKGHFGERIEEKLRGNGIGVRIIDYGSRNTKRSVSSRNNEIKVDIDHAEKYLVELRVRSVMKLSPSAAVLLPKYCYATPVERQHRWLRYSLIEDGCPVEDGVEIMDSKAPIIKITVPGIQFQGTTVAGFLVRCKVRACFLRDPKNARTCYRNCPKKRSRSKRDIARDIKVREILSDFEIHGTPIILP